MFNFGKRSKEKLEQVIEPLKKTAIAALSLNLMDFSVIEGIRSKEKQDEYFKSGKSKLKWPNSSHNVKSPNEKSRAMDIVPFVNGKISWKKEHCLVLAGIILATGKILGYDIRWGGNWDMDGEPVTDQKFQDLVHFEIRRK